MSDKPPLPLQRALIAAAVLALWGWVVAGVLLFTDGLASGILGIAPVDLAGMDTAAAALHGGVFLIALLAIALMLDRIFAQVLSLLDSAPFRVTTRNIVLFRLAFCLGALLGLL